MENTKSEQLMTFWKQLLKRSKERGFDLFATRTGSHDYYMMVGAGLDGIWYHYQIRRNDASIRLYIDTEDSERNRGIFGALRLKKQAIERAFGEPLEWKGGDTRANASK